MILLDATTKEVTLKLSGTVTTNQLPFVTTYADITTTTFVAGEQDGVSNNATRVVVLSSPASSAQRQLKFLSIKNADTVNATVIVEYNNNATYREIYRVTLTPNMTLVYVDGRGFYAIDASGNILTSSSAGGTSHNLLSSTHPDTVVASSVLGDIVFANSTPAWTKLAGNTTAVKQYLSQTGTGAVSAAPTWGAIAAGDLPAHTHAAGDVTSGIFGVVRGGTGLSTVAIDSIIYTSALDTFAAASITAFGRSLIDDADAATGRTTLGLGTIATQAASAVSITGGSITNITDLAVADGGTGASTAATARSSLGAAALGVNTDITGLTGLNTQNAVQLSPFNTLAGNTSEIRFLELAANGVNFVGFKAPDALAADRIWTLPNADGASGDVLKTNGSGVLGWAKIYDFTSEGVKAFKFLPLDYVRATSTATVFVANRNNVLRFYLSHRLIVTKVQYDLVTAAVGNMSLGIYANDGLSLLIDIGPQSTNVATGVKTVTLGTPVTLEPGFYIYAWTVDNITATFRTIASTSGYSGTLNASTVHFGYGANVSAAGQLPATTGALTGTNPEVIVAALQQ